MVQFKEFIRYFSRVPCVAMYWMRIHLLAGEGQYEQVFLGKKRLSGRDSELASVVSASGRYQACLRSSVGTLGVPGAKKYCYNRRTCHREEFINICSNIL